MAVTEQQIQIPIVIKVEKLHTPATQQTRSGADASGHGHVVEALITIVVVEGEHLPVNIRHKQVNPAVLVVIRRIDPHARTGVAVGTISHSRLKADFLEPAFPPIAEEEVSNGVVCHKEVHPTIIV